MGGAKALRAGAVAALVVGLAVGCSASKSGGSGRSVLTGESGAAVVLRDGRSYGVHWSRPAADAGTTYTYQGRTLPLRPGRTWIVLDPG